MESIILKCLQIFFLIGLGAWIGWAVWEGWLLYQKIVGDWDDEERW